MKKSMILVIVLLTLLVISFTSAEVIVFDQYNTKTTLEDGKLIITKQLRLKNVGSNPIIPGEIHFKISQENKKGLTAPQVGDFTVIDKFGKQLATRKFSTDTEVDLVFTIWDPLLPQFYYEMTMTYEIPFNAKGVLFYHILLPEERTTIPVKSSSSKFVLPKKYHITYFSPDGEVSAEKEGNTIAWDTKDAYYVEYSIIPFPRIGVKAVNVFWTLIILLFLINLFFRMKKKAQMANES